MTIPRAKTNIIPAPGKGKVPRLPLTITAPYPPTANHFKAAIIVKGRVRFLLTKQARDYKSLMAETIEELALTPLDGTLYVRVEVYRPRRVGDGL